MKAERLPGGRDPKPVWPWCSAAPATPADVKCWWQSFLCGFDLEHTFRLMKQTPGWTAPKIRHADTADLRTWPVIAAHTQLRPARPPAEDLRRPWERPTPAGRDVLRNASGPHLAAVKRYFADALSRDGIEQLFTLLDRVRTHFDDARGQATDAD
ncbi:hypothetical protein ACF07T_21165 [Streptomyces sp. NPDC015184]|uniref:hypothetical protein n=1 Tax=Streptomyces sp. NPDC015184 TaxID=3364946 RepID=UPI0036F82982